MGNVQEKHMLSLAQKDIFFDQLHDIKSSKYNIGGYIELDGVDVDKLRLAHVNLISNNKMFSFHCVAENGAILVEFNENLDLNLEVFDFSGKKNPNAYALNWINEIFNCPIDIKSKKLFYSCLIKVSNSAFYYLGIAHHIIIDGWGFSNWIKQLSDYYNEEDSFQECCVDIEAYFHKDIQYVDSSKYSKDKLFWSEYLKELPGRPFVKKNIEVGRKQDKLSNRKRFKISPKLIENLKLTSKIIGENIPSFFLGLISYYFCRASQSSEIIIGVPVHGRRGAAQKNIISLYSSVIPLKIIIDETLKFEDFILSIKKEQLKTFRHQRYPIGDLLKDKMLNVRDGLFDININYLKFDSNLKFGNTFSQYNYVENNSQTNPFTVTVLGNSLTDDIELQVDYNLTYFEDVEIDFFFERITYLIEQIISNPRKKLEHLDVVSPKDNEEISAIIKKDDTLDLIITPFELFEKQTEAQSNKIAISWKGQSFTYHEVNQLVDILSKKLLNSGVVKGDLIGLLIERDPLIILSILGLHKIGAAFLPLDMTYPETRINYMIQDSRCKMILTSSNRKHDINKKNIYCQILHLDLDELKCEISGTSRVLSGENHRSEPKDIAYVIYTSGSTGNPKGVLISQKSLSNFLQSMQKILNFTSNDFLLATTPFSFDISILELLLPLICGGTVRIFDRQWTQNISEFIDEFNVQPITMLQMTPSGWNILMAAGWQGDKNITALVGGESLSRHVAENLSAKVNVLWNMYGPTETTIWSSCTKVNLPYSYNCIGKPIDNTDMIILDNRHRKLPIGIFGFLFIGGQGVAKEYLNRPEITREKFSIINGKRWYSTGDIARFTFDKNFEFQGRNDNQVKIDGHRIELGEIENAILMEPDILLCSAVLKILKGKSVICAYYKSKLNNSHENNIKKNIKERLPKIMHPTYLIRMDDIPLTPSGKVDINSLPAPDALIVDKAVESFEGTPKKLVNIFSTHLNLRSIDLKQNFFDLGANSQDMVRVLDVINSEFGTSISIIDLFENSSLETISKLIDTNITGKVVSDSKVENRSKSSRASRLAVY